MPGDPIGDLAAVLARVERLERQIAAPSQLENSSIENGALTVKDLEGVVRQILGRQFDGTVTAASFNGPPPPRPTAPVVEPYAGGLAVTWDGDFAGGEVAPMDFARVEVHLSTDPFFTPERATLHATFETAQGATAALLLPADTEFYVALLARSQSGVAGAVSTKVAGQPLPLVDQAQFDQLEADLAALDAEVVQVAGAATQAQQDATEAFNAAVTAQGAADAANVEALAAAGLAGSKGEVIVQISAPTGSRRQVQNLWIRLPDHVPHRWNPDAGSSGLWQAVTDQTAIDAATAAAAAATAASTAQSAADAAAAAAGTAQGTADTALSTANGKNKVTWSTAAPTVAAGQVAGDVWFRLSGTMIIGQWERTASAWVTRTIDNAVIANLNAGKITAGFLAAARIAAGTITATHLAADSVIAEKVAAGAITALKLAASAVEADKIAANAVTAVKIAAGAVTAAKLEATLVLASTIVAGSSGTGARVVLDSSGLTAYDNANQVIMSLTGGNAVFSGQVVGADIVGSTFRTATSGNRLEISHSGEFGRMMFLSDQVGDVAGSLYASVLGPFVGGSYNSTLALWCPKPAAAGATQPPSINMQVLPGPVSGYEGIINISADQVFFGGGSTIHAKAITGKYVKGATQSIPHATWTTVTWPTVEKETLGSWMTTMRPTTSNLRVPVTGWYELGARVEWAANPNNRRSIRFWDASAGAQLAQEWDNPVVAALPATSRVTEVAYLTAGTLLNVQVYQDTGAALNCGGSTHQSRVWIRYLGVDSI